jgi:8-oxo-dGTP pyrophosphatase MutT (NUDIX family)
LKSKSDRRAPQSLLNPWTTINTKTVFENPWLKVVDHEVLNPKNVPAKYGVVEFKNTAIGIIALEKDQQIYLVGQWRYPLGFYSWEIPEGGGRKGFDTLDEAKRELKEETGLTAQTWQPLQTLYLSNSTTDEKAIIYLATDLTLGEAQPEDTEILNIKKVSLQEADQMIRRSEITDAISVAAIQRLMINQFQGLV